jgi:RNA polymerase sigma factor (sigma-70 family)
MKRQQKGAREAWVPNARLTPEQWQIVVDYLPFIRSQAAAQPNRLRDIAYDFGLSAAINAVARWTPEGGASVSYLLLMSVTRAITSNIGAMLRRRPNISPVGIHDHFDLCDETSPRPQGEVEAAEMTELLRNAMEALPPSHRSAIFDRFWRGDTFEAIGKRAGVTSETARVRVKKALRVLGSKIGKEYHYA